MVNLADFLKQLHENYKKVLINRKGKKVRVKLTSLDSHSFSSASKGTTKGDPFIVIVFTI